MDYLFILGGLLGLMAGGDLLVRGAVALAQRWRVSPMVIGLTLVGFGTSTPELVTSVQAALQGAPGIAIGNVVGSNIANILLILGAAAVLLPISVDRAAFRRDGVVLALATVLCLGCVWMGVIGRGAGAVLLVALVVYLWAVLRRGEAAGDLPSPEAVPEAAGRAVLALAGGLVLTLLAARFLVEGAVALASDLGVSEALIGVTIVAVGTSMPELVTSVMAARRGQADVALGNVIGSNLFNILGILGVTALFRPVAVPPQIAGLDIWVMVAATALLVVVAVSGWRISRREGALLLAGYGAYLAVLVGQVV